MASNKRYRHDEPPPPNLLPVPIPKNRAPIHDDNRTNREMQNQGKKIEQLETELANKNGVLKYNYQKDVSEMAFANNKIAAQGIDLDNLKQQLAEANHQIQVLKDARGLQVTQATGETTNLEWPREAQEQLSVTNEQLSDARDQLSAAQAQLSAAQKQLSAAQKQLSATQTQLSDTNIELITLKIDREVLAQSLLLVQNQSIPGPESPFDYKCQIAIANTYREQYYQLLEDYNYLCKSPKKAENLLKVFSNKK